MLQSSCAPNPTDAVFDLDKFCRTSLSFAQTRVGTVDPAIIPRSEGSEAMNTCANEVLDIYIPDVQNCLG